MSDQAAIPDAVRRLAEHPMRELPLPPGFERIEQDGVYVLISPFPSAQIVEPLSLEPADVTAAVETARSIVRERGKDLLAWWIAPEYAAWGAPLEEQGLVNEDTPGFEAVENAMVLVAPPAGAGGETVQVKQVESYDEYVAASAVSMDAFETPPEMRAKIEAGMPERYEEYCDPRNSGREFIASLDGRIVGAAHAALGDAGVNLFGGSVRAEARGQGVYRALTLARWELAVARGTPALTVQAGRMSKPIAERLGFQQVAAVRLYVDTLT